jgi:hypothetical protein
METKDTPSENGLSDFSAQITQAVENVPNSIVAIDARAWRRAALSGAKELLSRQITQFGAPKKLQLPY